jgi:hypothetical protein
VGLFDGKPLEASEFKILSPECAAGRCDECEDAMNCEHGCHGDEDEAAEAE